LGHHYDDKGYEMKRTLKIVAIVLFSGMVFNGCSGDSYSAPSNNTDPIAQEAMHDAAAQLSAQDIKNINNLK